MDNIQQTKCSVIYNFLEREDTNVSFKAGNLPLPVPRCFQNFIYNHQSKQSPISGFHWSEIILTCNLSHPR